MLEKETVQILSRALGSLEEQFDWLPPMEARVAGSDRIATVLQEVSQKLGDNYPYFHPLYAGQMLKPPHPVARTAYALAAWINPNNHALDGGRASSAMEKEAVSEIARMFGLETYLGHLTSGGTMANLEALWVAGQISNSSQDLKDGGKIAASSQAHYTHQRISSVLRLPFEKLDVDQEGRIDLAALEQLLQKGEIGCVVVTLGTTAIGSVDPLTQILRLREQYPFRLHVDAAYGGYFCLAEGLSDRVREAFDLIGEADSIVIDPHKHGLQPYGCGCVLFKDPTVGRFYRHDSPYTYFSSSELHLGEISLECSRAGAAAVALWATQRLLPLVPKGEFADGLSASLRAARSLGQRLSADARFVIPFQPSLDIVVWAPRAKSASASSAFSVRIFDEAAKRGLHLALANLPIAFFAEAWPDLIKDQPQITCLRSVLMKPEHEAWLDQIYRMLEDSWQSATEVAV